MLIEKAVPLVFFSGGLDSTAVLLNALQRYKKVDILTVELVGQVNKIERENKAIKAIISAIEANQDDSVGRIRHVNTGYATGLRRDLTLRFTQGVSWLPAALNYIAKDTNDVIMGYVSGDQGATNFKSLQYAWTYMLDAAGQIYDGDVRPTLSAPLIYTTKKDILRDYSPEIMALTSWCENFYGQHDDCGKCSSCKRMIHELSSWKAMNPEEYETRFLAKDRYETMLARYQGRADNHEKEDKDEIQTQT